MDHTTIVSEVSGDAARACETKTLPSHSVVGFLCKILDPQTRQLAQAIHGSDYIMSNDIVSSVIAQVQPRLNQVGRSFLFPLDLASAWQVSESRAFNAVSTELLSSAGCEIYFKPMRRFVCV
jgi:hypothetical protein